MLYSYFGGAGATSGVSLSATGDKYVFAIPFKAKVRKSFIIPQTNASGATGVIVAFDRRLSAGSDTSRGNGDCGALSATASTSYRGKMIYAEPSADITVNEGDEIVCQCISANEEDLGTHAGNTMLAWVGIELEYIPEEPGNNTMMVCAG